MVFAAVLQHQRAAVRTADNRRRHLDDQVSKLQKEHERLAEENTLLRQRMGWPNKFDDYFRELVIARRENENLRRQMAGLTEKDKSAAEFQSLLEKEQLEGNTAQEILREAKSAERAQAILMKADHGASGHSYGNDLVKSVAELIEANQRLAGQVANLECRSGPGGSVMPPCWVTSAGEIQYAFDVELKSDAAGRIVMHDSVATGPDEARARLFRAMKIDQPLSESDFLDQTQPFYAFGKAQQPECRFFVRVIDHTGPNQKEVFKKLLATVERHFYKKLMPNGSGESALLTQPANIASSSSDNQARSRRRIAPLTTDDVN